MITIPKAGNRAHVFVSGSAILLLALRLLVVALAIRLDSCGPVSFRQIRISRDNEQFKVLKLQSLHTYKTDRMGIAPQAAMMIKSRAWACYSLNECWRITQLLNVVKGDISLVSYDLICLDSRTADKLFWEVDIALP